MKLSKLAVLAVVAPSAAGFAPTANQRQSASKNVAFVKSSGASTYSRGAMSMELQAFLGAGIGSLGLVLSGLTATSTVLVSEPVLISQPSITISSAQTTADGVASSTRAPVMNIKDLTAYEEKLEKEVEAIEKEAKKDAKVRIGIFYLIAIANK